MIWYLWKTSFLENRERERESRCRSMFRRVFKVHHTLERLLASSVLPARFSAFPPSLCNCTKVFASTEAQWSRSPLAEKHRHIKFNKPLNLNIFHLASRHFHLAFPISICHQHCGGVASWFMVYGFPKWFPILRCLSRSWEQKVLTEKQPIWIQSASIGKSICGHFWNKTISSHFFFGFLTVLLSHLSHLQGPRLSGTDCHLAARRWQRNCPEGQCGH